VPVEHHGALPAYAVERDLAAGRWASTLHVGSYDALALAYAALFEHLRERGHEPVAPIVETYLNDPSTVPPAELLTRISVPV
jgi:effector-binding domain-containing protein